MCLYHSNGFFLFLDILFFLIVGDWYRRKSFSILLAMEFQVLLLLLVFSPVIYCCHSCLMMLIYFQVCVTNFLFKSSK